MKDCRITIITPTYNRSHTLTRAYESLKKQSFKGFKWLIYDDGSTDSTQEVVQSFKEEDYFEISYKRHENSKKFYTVFKAIETVDTDYFAILDSDDAYPDNALEILIKEADKLNPQEFISLIGHSINEDGKIIGDLFPGNGFDGSVLEMRYKYKIKGDKNGLFITKPYLKYLRNFDYESYKGKYAPQKIFFQTYDGEGMKTRFFNENVRIYYKDDNDNQSMSADRVKPTSYEGLKDGYLSFINSYHNQFWKYPIPMIKNMGAYLIYSKLLGKNLNYCLAHIHFFIGKLLSIILYPICLFIIYLRNK
jgi:glycosyltransferase involved in cell wall biosynthesis